MNAPSFACRTWRAVGSMPVPALVMRLVMVLTLASFQRPPDHVPGRVLVRVAQTQGALQNVLTDVRGTVLRSYHLVPDLYLIEVPASPVAVVAALEALGREVVRYADLDLRLRLSGDPDDEYFGQQWYLDAVGGLLSIGDEEIDVLEDADIDAPEAWSWTSPIGGFVVAILDSGLWITHEDLVGNLWTDDDGNVGWDFVTETGVTNDVAWHGTNVAGIIGAVGDNGTGVAGILWDCELMPLRFVTSSLDGVSGDVSTAIAALEYAVDHDVRLSNNSYGTEDASDEDLEAFYEAIAAAGARDHLFVCSAGNGGNDLGARPFYPASFDLDNVLAVTASDHRDELATGASYGATEVDLAAPGTRIYSTTKYGFYGEASGTSYACAVVTGVAAALWERHPDWSAADVKERLIETARPVEALDGTCVAGGIVNLRAALLPPIFDRFLVSEALLELMKERLARLFGILGSG